MLEELHTKVHLAKNPNIENERAVYDIDPVQKRLYQQIEKPQFLLFGMPDRAKHYYEMNTSQPPQGPILKKFPFIPAVLRDFINEKMQFIFNPNREAPYSGLHLIKQNLNKDLPQVDVTLIDHPKRKEILDAIDNGYFPIIGLSIGCENQIPDAEKLVEEIQQHYKKWADMMKFLIKGKNICPEWMQKLPGLAFVDSGLKMWILTELNKRFGQELGHEIMQNPELLDHLSPAILPGNYGASAAKKIYGNETPLNQPHKFNSRILWDDVKERKQKRLIGEEPYVGEGVHDMRVLLEKFGFKVKSKPNNPIVSEVIIEPNPEPKGLLKKIIEKSGISMLPQRKTTLNTAVGCRNKCDFCNTATHFQREKTNLFPSIDDMFKAILEKHNQDKDNPELTPEF